MRNNSKAVHTTRFGNAIKGINQYITGNVTIDGEAYTPATLTGVFTTALTAMESADKAHSQWLAATHAMTPLVAKATGVLKALGKVIEGQYGANQTVLDTFGLPVPKPPTPPTTAEKAAAALKRAATREARGTTTKKAKKAVKGNVQVAITAVPVVAVPAHEAPAPTATTPAPAGAGGAGVVATKA